MYAPVVLKRAIISCEIISAYKGNSLIFINKMIFPRTNFVS
ncbi:Uncharacterized protein dnl_07400 [Desulfonema limicola]|uniref:Uncharacterized protein n=1 Tax=Desulfonema limicola TaxID=45656 RepID=A0A975B499_9BACT|nr:Uncharacterized protein dnl_07400 [Desulfonema limicola]